MNWATLGDHDKRAADGEIYVKIAKPFHIHPKSRQQESKSGRGHYFSYDYAIFVLECCVEFNDYIQPICLPRKPFRPHLIGKKVTTIGWGHTKRNGSSPPILQSIDIEVLGDNNCSDIMGQPTSIRYNPIYLMCAGDPNDWDKGSCQNDCGRARCFIGNGSEISNIMVNALL